MIRPLFLLAVASVALVAGAAGTNPAASRDVLDTPAAKSPLAARALLNGVSRAGNRLVVVGQRGHVLLSEDNGTTWQQATVPTSSDLVAVSFPTPTTGWAVGHDGVVLRTTDAGATWTRQLDGKAASAAMVAFYERNANLPGVDAKRLAAAAEEAKRFATQGHENPFLDVWFQDEKTGFVVGAFGLILQTRDGGTSWEPWLHAVDNPKTFHLYAVRQVGADVYMTGEQGLLLKLDRAAGQFRKLEVPYQGTLFGVTGNAKVVVAFGLRGTILRSTDAGRSWQQVPAVVPVGLTAGAVDAKDRIFIVSQSGHVLVSTDDGASFKPARLERPQPAAAIAVLGDNTVLVAGPRGVHTQTLQ
jgi:photosystem II stability/assembly factor-like uncharacterized protein